MGNSDTKQVDPNQQLSENGVVNSNFIVQEPKTLMATDEKVVLYIIFFILLLQLVMEAVHRYKESIKKKVLKKTASTIRV